MSKTMRGTERVVMVSADCHAGPPHMADFRPHVASAYLEAFDDYAARVEAYEAALRQRLGASVNRGDSLSTGGALVHAGHEGLWDIDARARDLDREGLAAEVIFPQGAVPFAPYPPVGAMTKMDFDGSDELRNAGAQIYNRWLADFCSLDPTRHLGIAVLPIRDVDAAVREVRWARDGLNGGVSLPPIVGDDVPFYNDPVYEPLWAACEAQGTVINMHGGSQVSYGEGPERLALTLSETDWFSHRALWFLIFSGVFERHPDLHVAMTEQRTHWAPPLVADLDSIYETPRCRPLRAHLPKKPSEYFATNCFLGASFMSKGECEQRHVLGTERYMWGNDYPHVEGVWPFTEAGLRFTFGGVPEDEVRLMLGENAATCYRLDDGVLGAAAAKVGPTYDEIFDGELVFPTEPIAEFSWAFRRHGAWH